MDKSAAGSGASVHSPNLVTSAAYAGVYSGAHSDSPTNSKDFGSSTAPAPIFASASATRLSSQGGEVVPIRRLASDYHGTVVQTASVLEKISNLLSFADACMSLQVYQYLAVLAFVSSLIVAIFSVCLLVYSFVLVLICHIVIHIYSWVPWFSLWDRLCFWAWYSEVS